MPLEHTGLNPLAIIARVVVASLLLAVFVRAACALFNKWIGKSSALGPVPEPTYGKAFGIVLIAGVINAFASVVIEAGVRAAESVPPIIAPVVTLPVAYLVVSSMISSMLPTSFGRAMMISLLAWLIGLVLGLIIVVLVWLMWFKLPGLATG